MGGEEGRKREERRVDVGMPWKQWGEGNVEAVEESVC